MSDSRYAPFFHLGTLVISGAALMLSVVSHCSGRPEMEARIESLRVQAEVAEQSLDELRRNGVRHEKGIEQLKRSADAEWGKVGRLDDEEKRLYPLKTKSSFDGESLVRGKKGRKHAELVVAVLNRAEELVQGRVVLQLVRGDVVDGICVGRKPTSDGGCQWVAKQRFVVGGGEREDMTFNVYPYSYREHHTSGSWWSASCEDGAVVARLVVELQDEGGRYYPGNTVEFRFERNSGDSCAYEVDEAEVVKLAEWRTVKRRL